jgi:CTP-dependent riboflavin kinase
MVLINAGAILALYSTSQDVADQAEISAETALRIAKQNEKVTEIHTDQSCVIAEQFKVAPAYCDEPGVGLPE